jgi:hypothetical protein
MSFTDAMRRASISYHTKDQLRGVIRHRKPPTLYGFARHLAEYKHVHATVAKPVDFYSDDIDRDMWALWDPESPLLVPETYVSKYAVYLMHEPSHIQGAHWYVLSCAHASGGQAIAASIAEHLGISSAFLKPRDVAPIKAAFEQWTAEWTDREKQDCLDAVPDVFTWATHVNDMLYS